MPNLGSQEATCYRVLNKISFHFFSDELSDFRFVLRFMGIDFVCLLFSCYLIVTYIIKCQNVHSLLKTRLRQF